MIYVLGQIWIWLLLALILGMVLSWLWLRLNASSRTEEELGPWRDRVSSLEHERDALRRDLGAVRDRATESEAQLSALRDDLAERDARLETLLRELDESKGEPSYRNAPSDGASQKGNGTEDVVDAAPADATPQAREEAVETTAAESPAADQLSKIKGIGAALEKKLNAMGISTFAQLAELSETEIVRIEDAIGFKGRITREDWVGQARKLLPEPR